MNDGTTLSDRYLMLGLKLKENGRVRCMFCHVQGIEGCDGVTKVNHHPACIVVDLYVRGVEAHGQSLDATRSKVDEEKRN